MINLPNMITLIRFFLVPVFLIVFWPPDSDNILLAMIILAAAGITDVIDGYLARRYNMVTKLGKIIDPLADKLMVIAAMVSLLAVKRFPLWLAVLVLSKEILLIMGSFFMVMKQKSQVGANLFGKAATITVYAALFTGAFNIYGKTIVSIIAGAVSLIALFNYVNIFIQQRKK